MPKFECSRCGKCCMPFGDFIRIERKLSDTDFYCRLSLTHELFIVHVERSSRELFLNPKEGQDNPKWCPFLRKINEEFVCTIYQTRPTFCREFKCYSMQILDANGRIIGRVGGRRSLLSSDDLLTRFWNERIAVLKDRSDREWLARIKQILESGGYVAKIFD